MTPHPQQKKDPWLHQGKTHWECPEGFNCDTCNHFTGCRSYPSCHSSQPAAPIGCNLETIRPTPECFGKWQGLDSEKCKACFTWGYCADLEARTATIRKQTLDEVNEELQAIKGYVNGITSGDESAERMCQHILQSIGCIESPRTPSAQEQP